MTLNSVDLIIKKLEMQELKPEGGYWCPQYRSSLTDKNDNFVCGSILYLITPESFSHFHKLTADEIFYFCSGDAIEQIIISPDGKCTKILLGADIFNNESVISVVKAGCWQAAKLVSGGEYALLSATTIPAYVDGCVEHANANEISNLYPLYKEDIMKYL